MRTVHEEMTGAIGKFHVHRDGKQLFCWQVFLTL